MAQTVFKSTEGLMEMDYAAIYREKHIKGMLDRRIMGDKQMEEEVEEPTQPEEPEAFSTKSETPAASPKKYVRV